MSMATRRSISSVPIPVAVPTHTAMAMTAHSGAGSDRDGTQHQHTAAASQPGMKGVSTRGRERREHDREREREQPAFYAQAIFDFVTEDPHQLAMAKGDMMRIIKTEETGWWAATHANDTRVGWIPKDFVRPLRPNQRPTQRT